MAIKIGIILGTRPEITKMAPIIRYCQKKSIDFFVIHSNQHYSANMDGLFFKELELPQPKYNLGIGSGAHGEMTGRMMIEIEKVLKKEMPDVVLVEGDTNTVLAGALVASKMDIKVGHVEAGLRSYDRTMPEELNRIVADHLSDYLFAPTKRQEKILLEEGIDSKKIFVVGNTSVDTVFQSIKIAEKKSDVFNKLKIKKGEYKLVTAHRPATVDVKENISEVLRALATLAQKYDKDIVFPAHPRTQKMMASFNIVPDKRIIIIDPVGYLDMLMLQKHAHMIITDSGGIQEEAVILKKKSAVIRENTERPEALDVGGSVLVGNSDHDRIVDSIGELLEKEVEWYNPFGDGTTGEQIIEILNKYHT